MRNTLTCILLLCLSVVYSQELVTDYFNPSVKWTTPIQGKVGFEVINGQQYMIQLHEDCKIFKYQNNQFVLHKSLDHNPFDGVNVLFNAFQPNRSGLDIINGRLVLQYDNSIIVIDIEDGSYLKQIDLEANDLVLSRTHHMSNRRIYFEAFNAQIGNRTYYYDFQDNSQDMIPDRISSSSRYFNGDIVYYQNTVNPDEIKLYNTVFNNDYVLHTSSSGVFDFHLAMDQKTLFIFENDGQIYQVVDNNNIQKVSCDFNPLLSYRDMKVNGDNLVYIFEVGNGQDRIEVLNFTSCQIVDAFDSGAFESPFFAASEILQNGDNSYEYSIVNIDGGPLGNQNGYRFILDHNDNDHIQFGQDGIQNFTSFKKGDDIHFVGFTNADVEADFYDLHRYNVRDKSIHELCVDPPNSCYLFQAVHGFYADDELIVSTNGLVEDPKVWSIDASDNYNLKMPLDFSVNFGFDDITDIEVIGDQMFFKAHGGFFCLGFNHFKDLIDIKEPAFNHRIYTLAASYGLDKMITSGNYMALSYANAYRLIIARVNVTTSEVETLEIPMTSPIPFVTKADPYFIFNYENEMGYYDIENHKIEKIDIGIENEFNEQYLVAKAGYHGFIKDKWGDWQIGKFDYSTKTSSFSNYKFEQSPNLIQGPKNTFYAFQSNQDSTKIVRFDQDLNHTVVFDGEGRLSTQTQRPLSFEAFNFTSFEIRKDDKIKLITDNGINTKTLDLVGLTDNSIRIHNHTGKHILTVNQNGFNDYWFHNFFRPDKKIFSADATEGLNASYITDSLAILVFKQGGLINRIVKYDYINDETHFLTDIKNNFAIDNIRFLHQLNETQFIVSKRTPIGLEPWILDVNQSSFELIGDIMEGEEDSRPLNFVELGDHIYFTANTQDFGRQWFRILKDGVTSTLEAVVLNRPLKVIPNPSTEAIALDKDLNNVHIVDASGRSMQFLRTYSNGERINVSDMETGSYFIIAKDDSGSVYAEKFMKM